MRFISLSSAVRDSTSHCPGRHSRGPVDWHTRCSGGVAGLTGAARLLAHPVYTRLMKNGAAGGRELLVFSSGRVSLLSAAPRVRVSNTRCACTPSRPPAHLSPTAPPCRRIGTDFPSHRMCAVPLALQAGAPQVTTFTNPERVLSDVPRGASAPSRSRVGPRRLTGGTLGASDVPCIAIRTTERRTARAATVQCPSS